MNQALGIDWPVDCIVFVNALISQIELEPTVTWWDSTAWVSLNINQVEASLTLGGKHMYHIQFVYWAIWGSRIKMNWNVKKFI